MSAQSHAEHAALMMFWLLAGPHHRAVWREGPHGSLGLIVVGPGWFVDLPQCLSVN